MGPRLRGDDGSGWRPNGWGWNKATHGYTSWFP
jgi:hypothetical protein